LYERRKKLFKSLSQRFSGIIASVSRVSGNRDLTSRKRSEHSTFALVNATAAVSAGKEGEREGEERKMQDLGK